MILLDTHVLLWQQLGDRRLGNRARSLLQLSLHQGTAAVSAIAFWEIAMRVQKGQLAFDVELPYWRNVLISQGLVEIPVDGSIAFRAGLLTGIHGDPADRIIVATALGGHQLLTSDHRILAWSNDLDCVYAGQ